MYEVSVSQYAHSKILFMINGNYFPCFLGIRETVALLFDIQFNGGLWVGHFELLYPDNIAVSIFTVTAFICSKCEMTLGKRDIWSKFLNRLILDALAIRYNLGDGKSMIYICTFSPSHWTPHTFCALTLFIISVLRVDFICLASLTKPVAIYGASSLRLNSAMRATHLVSQRDYASRNQAWIHWECRLWVDH